jgi:UDP-glucose 4-epimerase
VIHTVEKVTGGTVPVQEGERRPGDPAVLVASSGKIRKALLWEPEFTDLESMVRTAWNWHRRHPDGFSS